MKKVAIITLMNGGLNFGNSLQNYALTIVLKKLNNDVYTIADPYKTFHKPFNWIRWIIENKIKTYIAVLVNYNRQYEFFMQSIKAQKAFLYFDKKYLKLDFDFCIKSQIIENVDKYDFYVAGSDQIWKTYSDNGIKLLTFAPKEKSVSYAASFGKDNINKNEKRKYIEALENIKYISVREDAGAKIINDLIDIKVPVHVDPTLLLNKDEWVKIMKKPYNKISEKYLLTYFLGNKNKCLEDTITKIAKEHNLKIINLVDRNDPEWLNLGPCEFLYMIYNSSLFYTDSFHGSVFSIIFNKFFVVTNRINKGSNKMSSRIDTLLSKFNLESRRGTIENNYCKDNLFEINYDNIDEILEEEKMKSINYLKTALNIK